MDANLIVTCGKSHINFWTMDGNSLTKRQGLFEVKSLITVSEFCHASFSLLVNLNNSHCNENSVKDTSVKLMQTKKKNILAMMPTYSLSPSLET